MNAVQKLIEIFSSFPGIGPRQAKRFVYFLLNRSGTDIEEFITLINELKKETALCNSCYRHFTKNKDTNKNCSICLDQKRKKEKLMVVAREVDFENIEKTGIYDGIYFILGGNIPILEKDPAKKVRIRELQKKVADSPISEITLAMNANPEGENTEEILREELKKVIQDKNIKILTLGRGLSTGVELEYSDSETIKNAFKNRTD